MPTPCYWLAPVAQAHVQLRRFTYGTECPCDAHGNGAFGHDASSGVVATVEYPLDNGNGGNGTADAGEYAGHSAWPTVCGRCGAYEFTVDDRWQVNTQRLYARHDTNEHTTLAMAGAGAMYDAYWYPDSWRGPDGIALVVRCPNMQDWTVDGPSTKGGRWVRSGDPRNPPTLNVLPSIAIGKPGSHEYYHGMLENGMLGDHLG